jgi:hypothetical protein
MDADSGQMARADFHLLTSDGFQIAVREVKLAASGTKKNPPVILVHGLRIPGIASFDLAVPRGIVGRRSGEIRICHLCDGRQRLWQLDQT